jgi:hypothetical protein
LTKATWWSGGIFLFLAFMLSLASSRGRAPRSVLDQAFPNVPASAPTAPSKAATQSPVPLTPAPQPAPATPNQGTKAPAKQP